MLQGVKIRNDEAKARMLLSLSIFSPFVTCDRNNQLLKKHKEKERFEYVYRRHSRKGYHFQYCNDSETKDSSGVRLHT